MTTAAGIYLAGCVLLVAAGVAKVRSPAPTKRALANLVRQGRAAPAWTVRVGGVLEVLIGTTALVTAAPTPAAAVAFVYLVFAGFVLLSLTSGRAGGCGCFGEAGADVSLSPLHAAVNLALAASAANVAAGGGLDAPGVEQAGLTLAGAGLAWVVYLVLVPLPRLLGAVREVHR